MCFGCSKEPSHRDGSFEYPQHMFWLRNKKIIFSYALLYGGMISCCLNWGFNFLFFAINHLITISTIHKGSLLLNFLVVRFFYIILVILSKRFLIVHSPKRHRHAHAALWKEQLNPLFIAGMHNSICKEHRHSDRVYFGNTISCANAEMWS